MMICQMATPFVSSLPLGQPQLCYPPPAQPLYQPNFPANYQTPIICMPYPSCGQPVFISAPQVPTTAFATTGQAVLQPSLPTDHITSGTVPTATTGQGSVHFATIAPSQEPYTSQDLQQQVAQKTPCGTLSISDERHAKSALFPSDNTFRPPFHSTGLGDTLDRSCQALELPSDLLNSNFINLFKDEEYKFDDINVRGLSSELDCLIKATENLHDRRKQIFQHLKAAKAIKQKLASKSGNREELLKSYRQHKRDALAHIEKCRLEHNQCEALKKHIRDNEGIFLKDQGGMDRQDSGCYQSLLDESQASTSQSLREDDKIKKTIVLPPVDRESNFAIHAEVTMIDPDHSHRSCLDKSQSASSPQPEHVFANVVIKNAKSPDFSKSTVEDIKHISHRQQASPLETTCKGSRTKQNIDLPSVKQVQLDQENVLDDSAFSDSFDTFLKSTMIAHLGDGERYDHIDVQGLTDEQASLVKMTNNFVQRKKNILNEILAAKAAKEQLKDKRNIKNKQDLLNSYIQHKKKAREELHIYDHEQDEYLAKLDALVDHQVKNESVEAKEASFGSLLVTSAFLNMFETSNNFRFDGIDILPIVSRNDYAKYLLQSLMEHKKLIVECVHEAKRIKEMLESGERIENRKELLSNYRGKKWETAYHLHKYMIELRYFLDTVQYIKKDLYKEEFPEGTDVAINFEIGHDTSELPSFSKWFPQTNYADELSESKRAKLGQARDVYGDLQRSYNAAQAKCRSNEGEKEGMLQSFNQHKKSAENHLAKLKNIASEM